MILYEQLGTLFGSVILFEQLLILYVLILVLFDQILISRLAIDIL
jgi:hypothetical protein